MSRGARCLKTLGIIPPSVKCIGSRPAATNTRNVCHEERRRPAPPLSPFSEQELRLLLSATDSAVQLEPRLPTSVKKRLFDDDSGVKSSASGLFHVTSPVKRCLAFTPPPENESPKGQIPRQSDAKTFCVSQPKGSDQRKENLWKPPLSPFPDIIQSASGDFVVTSPLGSKTPRTSNLRETAEPEASPKRLKASHDPVSSPIHYASPNEGSVETELEEHLGAMTPSRHLSGSEDDDEFLRSMDPELYSLLQSFEANVSQNERSDRSTEDQHQDVEGAASATGAHTSETHGDENPSEEPSTRKRKRQPTPREKRTRKIDKRPKTWIAVAAKQSRNHGKAYTTVRGADKPAKEMQPGCDASCRFGCSSRIPEEERSKIFEEFWKMGDYHKQLEYFTKRVKVFEKATGRDREDSVRQKSRTYTFKVNGAEVRVCKYMFMQTLGLSCDSGITTALRKQGTGSTLSPDKRGRSTDSEKNTARNKKKEELTQTVINHINSIERVPSHLCRSSIPDREYFPTELSIPMLHEMYLEAMQEIGRTENVASLRQYREIFNKNFNISFHMPKKDECDVCYALREASPEQKEEMERDLEMSLRDEICQRSAIRNRSIYSSSAEAVQKHLRWKEIVRGMKEAGKKEAMADPTVCHACYDLQKQMDCPKGSAGAFYYRRKLSVYNFTVYDTVAGQGYFYMWPENVAKRGANEIGTALDLFIKTKVEQGTRTFRFYSDNCGGQNKNRMILGLYAQLAVKHQIIISHTFLQVGHTQNEGDQMHSVNERRARRLNFYSPDQWYCHVRNAKRDGKPYIVTELSNEMILNLHTLMDCFKWEKNFCVSKVWQVTADYREPYQLQIVDDLDNPEPTTLNLRKKGRNFDLSKYCHPKAYTGEIPISTEKYNDLLWLCKTKKVVPTVYHTFYENLRHC